MKIITFGYRYKRDSPIGADIVFDARCLLEDPAEKTRLGQLTGLDRLVIQYLDGLPDVRRFSYVMYGGVAGHVEDSSVPGEPQLNIVAVACHSGRHRSVFLAERVAMLLRAAHNVEVDVEHLDMLRTPTEDDAPDFV